MGRSYTTFWHRHVLMRMLSVLLGSFHLLRCGRGNIKQDSGMVGGLSSPKHHSLGPYCISGRVCGLMGTYVHRRKILRYLTVRKVSRPPPPLALRIHQNNEEENMAGKTCYTPVTKALSASLKH